MSRDSRRSACPLRGADEVSTSAEGFAKRTVDFARCFLRLSNLPNYAFDRFGRNEAALWRQVAQTVMALDALDHRKPQNGGRPTCLRGLQESPNHAHDDS
jgi:hypothetical protein